MDGGRMDNCGTTALSGEKSEVRPHLTEANGQTRPHQCRSGWTMKLASACSEFPFSPFDQQSNSQSKEPFGREQPLLKTWRSLDSGINEKVLNAVNKKDSTFFFHVNSYIYDKSVTSVCPLHTQTHNPITSSIIQLEKWHCPYFPCERQTALTNDLHKLSNQSLSQFCIREKNSQSAEVRLNFRLKFHHSQTDVQIIMSNWNGQRKKETTTDEQIQ